MKAEVTVTHHPERSEFEATTDGKRIGYLDYVRLGNVLDLQHTVVNPEAGGMGVGSKLVRAALDTARAENLLIIPTCTFVPPYMARHPGDEDLLA